MRLVRVGLLVVGYPIATAVVVRFVPVVRERRWKWLVAHHLAVVSIVAGWTARGEPRAALANAAWLGMSSLWYALGGRRGRRR